MQNNSVLKQARERAIGYLCCPVCGGGFEEWADEIICNRCENKAGILEERIFCFGKSELPERALEKTMYGPELEDLERDIADKNSARLLFKKYSKNLPGETCCLDYGCGSSRQIFDLARENADGIVFGLDYDLEPLVIAAEAARFHNSKNIFLILQNSQKLPFKGEIFDVVTSHQVLEHVQDPEKAVEEISRTLKKKGIFEVDFPNGRSLGENFRNIFHKMTKTKNPHISRIGLEKAQKIFQRASFEKKYFQSVQAITGPLSYMVEGLIFRYIMKKHKIWNLRKKYQNNFLFRFLEKLDKKIGKHFPRAGHAFIFVLRKL